MQQGEVGDLLPSFFPSVEDGFPTIEREKMEKKKEPPSRMTPGERLDRQRDKRAQILAALAANTVMDVEQIGALLNITRTTVIETLFTMITMGIVESNTIPYTKKKVYSLTELGVLHAGNKGYRFDPRRSMTHVHHLLGLGWAYLFSYLVLGDEKRWRSDREIKEQEGNKTDKDTRWACSPDAIFTNVKNESVVYELELHPHVKTYAKRGAFYHGCLSGYVRLVKNCSTNYVVFVAENQTIANNIKSSIGKVVVVENSVNILLEKSVFWPKFLFVTVQFFRGKIAEKNAIAKAQSTQTTAGDADW